MLDFVLLQKQLNEMVLDQQSAQRSYDERIAIAHHTLIDWSERWQELADKIENSRTSWLLAAEIRESLHKSHALPPRPKQVSTIATDGSPDFS